ncbi:MAG: hypothetical protein HOG49_17725 [Candidatus Scalindua sp.]|jgi:hypothetical protein|nr:hypothetical protein [Candidatus Scalindua sp.]
MASDYILQLQEEAEQEEHKDDEYKQESLEDFQNRMEVVDMKIELQQDHSDLIFV